MNSLKLGWECLDLHSRQNGLSHFILCRDDLAFQPLCFWNLEFVIPPEAGILLLLFLDMLWVFSPYRNSIHFSSYRRLYDSCLSHSSPRDNFITIMEGLMETKKFLTQSSLNLKLPCAQLLCLHNPIKDRLVTVVRGDVVAPLLHFLNQEC